MTVSILEVKLIVTDRVTRIVVVMALVMFIGLTVVICWRMEVLVPTVR